MCAACLAAKFVYADTNGDAIKPRFNIFTLSFLIFPEFQKHFDGQLFGASAIPDDALNDASDARVLGAKKSFDIEQNLAGIRVGDRFRR